MISHGRFVNLFINLLRTEVANSPCTLVNTTKPYHCVVDSLTTSHLEKNEMFLDYKDLYGKLDFIEVFD